MRSRLLDAAHRQLGGPIVLVLDNLNTQVSQAMAEIIAARPCGVGAPPAHLTPVLGAPSLGAPLDAFVGLHDGLLEHCRR